MLHPGADGEFRPKIVIKDSLWDDDAVTSTELVDGPSLAPLVPIELTDPGGRV